MKNWSDSRSAEIVGRSAAIVVLFALTALPARAQQADETVANETSADLSAEWSSTDTKLANHYLGLLQAQPEYGEVLGLLWKLYEKRDSTAVLLDYIGKAAADDQEGTAKLLHGHLLRKNGDDDAASGRYAEVLELQPENVHALRGAAELFESSDKPAKALSYYNRLIPLLPLPDRVGADMRMRKATMLKKNGDIEGAVGLWFEVLGAFPTDLGLRTEVVGMLLEASRIDGAVEILRGLTETDDPELKVSAMKKLNRLYEFINDFDNAAAVAREGMELAHYKHHVHADFFARLVRLYERFGRLVELDEQLSAGARAASPTEQAVFTMVEFHRLTANPVEQEKWLARLVDLVPGNPAYRIDLTHTQIENDHFEEAAKTVDALLAESGAEAGNEAAAPLPLLLLRARIEISLEGKEAATDRLRRFVDQGQPTAESLRKVLAFGRENYLDGLVESLLRGPMASDEFAGRDDSPSAIRLASFLRERGRLKQARATLENFIAEAEGDDRRKGKRLEQVAAAYREMDMIAASHEAIVAAIGLSPDRLDLAIQRAEIEVEKGDLDAALTTYESVWRRSETIDDKTEIDQRLFSLLRGLTDEDEPADGGGVSSLPPPPPLGSSPAAMADYRRKMAARAVMAAQSAGSGNMGFQDEKPPKALTDFYEGIKKTVRQDPTIENRYRVAWWAFRQQDHPEMYHQLSGLHDPDKPILEAERLMLELAEQAENNLLMARQLELLSRVDEENKREYQQRWAEVRFKLGYEDEAVRLLQELVRDPEATLSTLKSLAAVYQQQGRKNDQVEVWRRAYVKGNVFEKRRVIKQLTNTLVELGRPKDALETLMDLIGHETDIIQKRKHFDSQLSLANRQYLPGELLDMYKDAAQQAPFERFYPEALARIHRAMGDFDAAFAAMKKAYYMSGEDRELLAELGEMAGETSDLKAAIYYRRQLIAQGDGEEEADVESWKSLIGMLERDLRVADADRIRQRLEGKFGQDADFLKSMADYYQRSGERTAAIRVLEELVRLRSWDATAQLELGLLRREGGDLTGAMEAFEQVVAETAEAALSPAERDFEYLAVIDGGWFSGVGTRPDSGGLANFVRGIQDYRYMPLDLQEKLTAAYRRPHPEFHRVPRGDAFLRLRAIEEAAKLVAVGVGAEIDAGAEGPTAAQIADGRDRWVRRWDKPSEVSLTEKLWAFHHAGESVRSHRLVRETMMPMSLVAVQLDYLLLSLKMNRPDAVVVWLNERRSKMEDIDRLPNVAHQLGEGPTPEALARIAKTTPSDIADPNTLLMVAMYLVMREDETLLAEEAIRQIMKEVTISRAVGYHLIDELVEDGHTLAAFRLARVTTELRPDAAVAADYYRIAKLAQWLGLDDERKQALDQAVDALVLKSVEARTRGGDIFSDRSSLALLPPWALPTSFFQVAAEALSVTEDAGEREALRKRLMKQVSDHPAGTAILEVEAKMLIHYAAGEAAEGTRSLNRLMQMRSGGTRPWVMITSERDSLRTDFWSESEYRVHQLASYLPAGASRSDFYAAFAPLQQPVPSGEVDVDSQYAHFEIARLLWRLEDMSPPRRRLAVTLFDQQLVDQTSRMELVNMLTARGFQRDVIPLYDRLIREEPDDFTLVRGFFDACRETGDHQAALDLLNGYLARELPRAPGMTDGYLITEHSYFLELSRDEETLASYARADAQPDFPTDAGDRDGKGGQSALDLQRVGGARSGGGASDGAVDWSASYHAALARVHEAKGDDEAALRVYLHLRQIGMLELEDRVRAVDLLIEKGEHKEAMEWLAGMSFDQVPGTEVEALRRLVKLNAMQGQRDVVELGQLARIALDYGQPLLIADVAATLHGAGMRAEAESMLLLQARKTDQVRVRSELLFRLVTLRLAGDGFVGADANAESEVKFAAVREVVGLLFETLTSEDPVAPRWLRILRVKASANPQQWLEGLENLAAKTEKNPASVLSAARGVGLVSADSAPLDLARLLVATLPDHGGDFEIDPQGWSSAGWELAVEVLGAEPESMPLSESGERLLDIVRESLAAASRNVAPAQFDSAAALSRRIRALSQLGLRDELEELHQRLILEVTANGLDRRLAVDQVPMFELRWQLPRTLADSGETDLAAALYRCYYDSLARITPIHSGFVGDYARFLMAEGDWMACQQVLQRLFHKSVNGDAALLAEWATGSGALDAAGDGAGNLEAIMGRFFVTPGVKREVSELVLRDAAVRNGPGAADNNP